MRLLRRFAGLLLRIVRKSAVLGVFAAVLLAMNLAVLTVDAAYDAARRVLWSVASTVAEVPESMLTTKAAMRQKAAELEEEDLRKRKRIGRLETENAAKTLQLDELKGENLRKSRQVKALSAQSARAGARVRSLEKEAVERTAKADPAVVRRVASVTDRLARRTLSGMARNVSSMAGESLPLLGPAVIVGVTYLEISDACATLREIGDLRRELGAGDASPDAATCGYSMGKLWQVVRGAYAVDDCQALNAGLPQDEQVDCSDVRRPGREPVAAPRQSESVSIKRPGSE